MIRPAVPVHSIFTMARLTERDRQTTLSPATDGDRGPFATHRHYAWMIRNLLSNIVPRDVDRIVLDISKTPAFCLYDSNDDTVSSKLDDADQRGMSMFLSACGAVINGHPLISPFRAFLRWINGEEYNIEILVVPDSENQENETTMVWRLNLTDSVAEFNKLHESAVAR